MNGTAYTCTATAITAAQGRATATTEAFDTTPRTPAAPSLVLVGSVGARNASIVVSIEPGSTSISASCALQAGGGPVWGASVNVPDGTTTIAVAATGLEPNTTYVCQANATNAAGTSPATLSASFITAVEAPWAPASVAVSAIAPRNATVTVTLGYNGGAWVTSVAASCGPAEGGAGAWGEVQVVSHGAAGTTVSFSAAGLEPNTTYVCQANATSAAGTSPATLSASFITAAEAPWAPASVAVSAIAPRNVTVTVMLGYNGGAWVTSVAASCGPAEGGAATWGAVQEVTLGAAGTTVSFSAAGLEPNTTYVCQANATSAAGTSPATLSASFITAAEAPWAPASVAVSAIAPRNATVTVTLGYNGGAWVTSVAASCRPAEGGAAVWGAVQAVSLGAAGTTVSFSAAGLEPNTTYVCQANATSTAGTSPATLAASFITAVEAPWAPASVAVSGIAPRNATVTVTLGYNGGAWVTSVAASCGPAEGGAAVWGAVQAVSLGAAGTTVSFSAAGLEPNTTYVCQANATSTAGTSPATLSASFITAAEAPWAPASVAVSAIAPRNATVTVTLGYNGGAWVTSVAASCGPAEAGAGAWGEVQEVSLGAAGTTVSFSAAGLEPNTTYVCQANATSAAGTSSAMLSASFITAAEAPWAPALVAVSAIAPRNATVTVTLGYNGGAWVTSVAASCGPAEGGAAAWGEVQAVSLGAAGTTVSFSAAGLEPNTTYVCQANATSAAGTSPATLSASFITAAEAPWAPASVAVSAIAPRNATVTVTLGYNGGAWVTSVAASCGPAEAGAGAWGAVQAVSLGAAGTTVSFSAAGLEPNTTYVCLANATSAAGTSPATLSASFITAVEAPWAPASVAVSAIAPRNATVTVTLGYNGGAWVTSVAASCGPAEGGAAVWGAVQAVSLGAAGTTVSFSAAGLEPNTTYVCQANATSAAGTSPATLSASFITAAEAPWAPASVAVSAIAPRNATVTVTLGYNGGAWVTSVAASCGPAEGGAAAWGEVQAVSLGAAGTTVSFSAAGLEPNTTYVCRANATSAAGTSPATLSASFIMAAEAPWAPASVAVSAITPRNATVTVTLGYNGGAWVTSVAASCGPAEGGAAAWGAVQAVSLGAAGTTVSFSAAGLEPNTTYVCQANATSAAGTSPATLSASFITAAEAPWAPASVAVSAIAPRNVTVTVMLGYNGGAWVTSVLASCGPAEGGAATWGAVQEVSLGAAGTTVSFSAAGLEPNTTYVCQANATSAAGTSPATLSASFITAAEAPWAPASVAVSAIAPRNATVTVTLGYNGGAWVTSVAASCGPAEAGAGAWGEVQAVSLGAAGTTVSLSAAGLEPNTTYVCLANATSAAGTSPATLSASFITAAEAPWAPASVAVSAIAPRNATVTVTLGYNGGAWVTSVAASCGPAERGAAVWGEVQAVSLGAAGTTVSFSAAGLEPNTTYVCQANATSTAGTSPATLSASFITAAEAPWAPASVAVSEIAPRNATVTVTLGYNGGAWVTSVAASCGPAEGGATAWGAVQAVSLGAAGTTVSFSAAGLEPNTTYVCQANATSAAGTSPATLSASFITAAEAPWAPASVAVSAIAPRNATVTVTLGYNGGAWVTSVAASCGPAERGAAVWGEVQAANATSTAGTSPATLSASFITAAEAPWAPASVAVSEIAPRNATVTVTLGYNGGAWVTSVAASCGPAEGGATAWGAVQAVSLGAAGTTVSFSAAGLEPNTTYVCQANATSAAGTSPAKLSASFITAVEAPWAPASVAVSAIAPRNATVTVTLGYNGGAWVTSVAASCGPAEGGAATWGAVQAVSLGAAGTTVSFSAAGLEPNTTYVCQANATSAAGTSPATLSASFITAVEAPWAPASVAVSEIAPRNAMVTVTLGYNGGAWVTSVAASCGPAEGGATAWGAVQAVSLGAAGTTVSFSAAGLEPNTTYVCQANATSAAGTSPATLSASFITAVEAPWAPASVAVSEIAPRNATVTVTLGYNGGAWVTSVAASCGPAEGGAATWGAVQAANATSAAGTSPATLSASFITAAEAPWAPASVAVSAIAPRNATVTVTLGYNGGAWVTSVAASCGPAEGGAATWGAVQAANATSAAGTSPATLSASFITAVEAPWAPASVAVSAIAPRNATVTVTLGYNGGAWVTSVAASCGPAEGGAAAWGEVQAVSLGAAGTTVSFSAAGLEPNTTYMCRANATSAAGTSPVTISASFIAAVEAPWAPALVAVPVWAIGPRVATVTVTLGYNGGTLVTSVAASCGPAEGGAAVWGALQAVSLGAAGTTASFSAAGLEPNTTYVCRANATSAAGTSPATLSASFITAAEAPWAPASVAVSEIAPRNATVTVTLGYNGGAWVTSVAASCGPAEGGAPVWSTEQGLNFGSAGISVSFRATGLEPAKPYLCRAIAKNAAGISPATLSTSFSTAAEAPAMPASVAVSAIGSRFATVTVTLGYNGGAWVTSVSASCGPAAGGAAVWGAVQATFSSVLQSSSTSSTAALLQGVYSVADATSGDSAPPIPNPRYPFEGPPLSSEVMGTMVYDPDRASFSSIASAIQSATGHRPGALGGKKAAVRRLRSRGLLQYSESSIVVLFKASTGALEAAKKSGNSRNVKQSSMPILLSATAPTAKPTRAVFLQAETAVCKSDAVLHIVDAQNAYAVTSINTAFPSAACPKSLAVSLDGTSFFVLATDGRIFRALLRTSDSSSKDSKENKDSKDTKDSMEDFREIRGAQTNAGVLRAGEVLSQIISVSSRAYLVVSITGGETGPRLALMSPDGTIEMSTVKPLSGLLPSVEAANSASATVTIHAVPGRRQFYAVIGRHVARFDVIAGALRLLSVPPSATLGSSLTVNFMMSGISPSLSISILSAANLRTIQSSPFADAAADPEGRRATSISVNSPAFAVGGSYVLRICLVDEAICSAVSSSFVVRDASGSAHSPPRTVLFTATNASDDSLFIGGKLQAVLDGVSVESPQRGNIQSAVFADDADSKTLVARVVWNDPARKSSATGPIRSMVIRLRLSDTASSAAASWSLSSIAVSDATGEMLEWSNGAGSAEAVSALVGESIECGMLNLTLSGGGVARGWVALQDFRMWGFGRLSRGARSYDCAGGMTCFLSDAYGSTGSVVSMCGTAAPVTVTLRANIALYGLKTLVSQIAEVTGSNVTINQGRGTKTRRSLLQKVADRVTILVGYGPAGTAAAATLYTAVSEGSPTVSMVQGLALEGMEESINPKPVSAPAGIWTAVSSTMGHYEFACVFGTNLFAFSTAVDETTISMKEFNLRMGQWTDGQSGPGPATRGAFACQEPNVYVFGGTNAAVPTKNLYMYSTLSSLWSLIAVTGSEPPPRSEAVLIPLSGTSILLAGGLDGDGKPLSDVWRFDVTELAWTAVEGLDAGISALFARRGRSVVSAASLSDMFVFGGCTAEAAPSFFNDLFIQYLGDDETVTGGESAHAARIRYSHFSPAARLTRPGFAASVTEVLNTISPGVLVVAPGLSADTPVVSGDSIRILWSTKGLALGQNVTVELVESETGDVIQVIERVQSSTSSSSISWLADVVNPGTFAFSVTVSTAAGSFTGVSDSFTIQRAQDIRFHPVHGSYTWQINDQVPPGTYAIEVGVSDFKVSSTSALFTIAATASSMPSVRVADVPPLIATQSYTIKWTSTGVLPDEECTVAIVSLPAGNVVESLVASIAQQSVEWTAPSTPGEYRVDVRARNVTGESKKFEIKPIPPVPDPCLGNPPSAVATIKETGSKADAGTELVMEVGRGIVDLDASQSKSCDGKPVDAYLWTEVELSDPKRPALLQDNTTASTTATRLRVGKTTFQLKVTDRVGQSSTAEVVVTVLNRKSVVVSYEWYLDGVMLKSKTNTVKLSLRAANYTVRAIALDDESSYAESDVMKLQVTDEYSCNVAKDLVFVLDASTSPASYKIAQEFVAKILRPFFLQGPDSYATIVRYGLPPDGNATVIFERSEVKVVHDALLANKMPNDVDPSMPRLLGKGLEVARTTIEASARKGIVRSIVFVAFDEPLDGTQARNASLQALARSNVYAVPALADPYSFTNGFDSMRQLVRNNVSDVLPVTLELQEEVQQAAVDLATMVCEGLAPPGADDAQAGQTIGRTLTVAIAASIGATIASGSIGGSAGVIDQAQFIAQTSFLSMNQPQPYNATASSTRWTMLYLGAPWKRSNTSTSATGSSSGESVVGRRRLLGGNSFAREIGGEVGTDFLSESVTWTVIILLGVSILQGLLRLFIAYVLKRKKAPEVLWFPKPQITVMVMAYEGFVMASAATARANDGARPWAAVVLLLGAVGFCLIVVAAVIWRLRHEKHIIWYNFKEPDWRRLWRGEDRPACLRELKEIRHLLAIPDTIDKFEDATHAYLAKDFRKFFKKGTLNALKALGRAKQAAKEGSVHKKIALTLSRSFSRKAAGEDADSAKEVKEIQVEVGEHEPKAAPDVPVVDDLSDTESDSSESSAADLPPEEPTADEYEKAHGRLRRKWHYSLFRLRMRVIGTWLNWEKGCWIMDPSKNNEAKGRISRWWPAINFRL
eukprot:tig00000158_g10198.t1